MEPTYWILSCLRSFADHVARVPTALLASGQETVQRSWRLFPRACRYLQQRKQTLAKRTEIRLACDSREVSLLTWKLSWGLSTVHSSVTHRSNSPPSHPKLRRASHVPFLCTRPVSWPWSCSVLRLLMGYVLLESWGKELWLCRWMSGVWNSSEALCDLELRTRWGQGFFVMVKNPWLPGSREFVEQLSDQTISVSKVTGHV